MPGLKHLHTYKRIKHKIRKDMYKCTDPHCTHTSRAELMMGKAARCPYCDGEFIITPEHTRVYVTLHCKNCAYGKPKTMTVASGAVVPESVVEKTHEMTLEEKLAELLGEKSA